MRNWYSILLLISLILLSTTRSQANATFRNNQVIHLLHPHSSGSGVRDSLDCLSWRLAVETNNIRSWRLVPETCETYVGNYMLGKQYRKDCKVVADEAIQYAKTLNLTRDGKDIWVFDIDETTLSNLPYYARSDVLFGAVAYNSTKFDEWTSEGVAPAIPSMLQVYKTVQSLGIKTVFLTGTAEKFRSIRTTNLNNAGYYKWEKLILRGESDHGGTSVMYKSRRRTELVNEGYRVVGNIGDQWSDLLGDNVGSRTFKVPDPMYYIG